MYHNNFTKKVNKIIRNLENIFYLFKVLFVRGDWFPLFRHVIGLPKYPKKRGEIMEIEGRENRKYSVKRILGVYCFRRDKESRVEFGIPTKINSWSHIIEQV